MKLIKDLLKQIGESKINYYYLYELEDDNIIQLGRGNVISKDEIRNNPGNYPVYSSSSLNNGEIGKYGNYMFDDERISWSIDGGGKFFYRPATKYSITNVSGWLKVLDTNIINTKYLYYYLSNEWEKKNFDYSHKAHPSVIRKEYKIAIPSIEIQKNIVEILDLFYSYYAIKNYELSLRNKQHEYVSYNLFINQPDIKFMKVEEICKITKGSTPIQKAEPGEYPLVVTTTERKTNKTYQYNGKAVCIPMVSSRGHGIASLNHVYYQEGKFAVGTILCVLESLDENLINPKYLYYYFENSKDYTLVPLMKGGANVALHMDDIKKLEIPVPSLSTQNSIIEKLEIADELIKNDNSGIKKELYLREQQIFYYKNKLLTFEEVAYE